MGIENQTEELQPEALQTVDDINFVVSDTDEADIEVSAEKDEDPIEKAKERLKRENWWLSDYWQEKGMPREQMVVKTGETEISVYNWGDGLSEKQQADLRDAISKLSERTKFGLKGIEYILIDDKDQPHPYGAEGQLTRGQYKGNLKSFILYPAGIKEEAYRGGEIKNCSEMERVVIHEIGHHYEWQKSKDGEYITNSWFFQFGELDEVKKDRVVKNPEQTVTEYGKLNTSDDFCECLVASFYDKEKIMAVAPEKYQYILDNVLSDESAVSETSITKQADIALPRLPDTITYKTRESGVVFREQK